VQFYDAVRGDFIDYHTDTRAVFEGQVVASLPGAPVLTVSAGDTMEFWYRPILNGDPSKLGEQRSIPLEHGMVWQWDCERDDVNFKHGAWFPRGVRSGARIAFVFRWSNPERGVREYAHTYPHRVVLSDEERARCEAARALAAAKRERAQRRAPSVHTMELRRVLGRASRAEQRLRACERKLRCCLRSCARETS
jgi:hypothetical protein